MPGGQYTAYVPTYRRVLRQPWIASPHINSTYRKCGGGFAMTGAGASLLWGRATASLPAML
ncbi:MAG: hypothetical protein LBM98_02230 [Oscillospiraceae bacterium]|nr:hypothetical protein [Oscillospiraceae bacterium]